MTEDKSGLFKCAAANEFGEAHSSAMVKFEHSGMHFIHFSIEDFSVVHERYLQAYIHKTPMNASYLSIFVNVICVTVYLTVPTLEITGRSAVKFVNTISMLQIPLQV